VFWGVCWFFLTQSVLVVLPLCKPLESHQQVGQSCRVFSADSNCCSKSSRGFGSLGFFEYSITILDFIDATEIIFFPLCFQISSSIELGGVVLIYLGEEKRNLTLT